VRSAQDNLGVGPALNAEGHPLKIALQSCGSRGDVQPYIALATALKEVGYQVMILSNRNHEEFVTACDLRFAAVFSDSEAALRGNPAIMESMATGDVRKFHAGVHLQRKMEIGSALKDWRSAIDAFNPDLLMVGTLSEYFGNIAKYKLRMPTCEVRLQMLPANPRRMLLGLPNLPFGLNGRTCRSIVTQQYDRYKNDLDPVCEAVLGFRLCDTYTKQMALDNFRGLSVTPVLLGQASCFADVLYPEIPRDHPNVRCVGQFVIEAKKQTLLANRRKSFGDPGDLAKLAAFFAAGSRPVYMGWGSMTCRTPEFMVDLVIRALQHSGARAIIQSGWAHLSMETLRAATADESLLEYAEENVMFMEASPHEWLFPQCACIVHHGGAGTTACAARAGVPMIITPIFLDQFDHAYVVNELGIGVGFERQFQGVHAVELGEALKRCVSDAAIAERAKEVGARMRAENAIPAVLEVLGDFWSASVESGSLQRSIDEQIQASKMRVATSLWHRVGTLCSSACGNA